MKEIVSKCKQLLEAYKQGKLGNTIMPEESHPNFEDQETRLVYFTLPMIFFFFKDKFK